MRHFLDISDCTADELRHLLDVSVDLKRRRRETGRNEPILADRTLAMIFEKQSLRTRASFAVAMTHLGGSALLLRPDEVGLGTREPLQDIARVLAGMCDGIMARTFEHRKVIDLARWSSVPVINGLTDHSHPCQAMADLMTLHEKFGSLAGRTMAFIGDGNNVARSLATACAKFQMNFVLAAPPGYTLPEEDLLRARRIDSTIRVEVTDDPRLAVRNADAIVTDTWVSMGQEAEKIQRVEQFAGFQVNDDLLAAAPAHAVVLHCLPAYRGLEISESVMEGPRSLIFPEAENRLHFQKGLLAVLLGGL